MLVGYLCVLALAWSATASRISQSSFHGFVMDLETAAEGEVTWNRLPLHVLNLMFFMVACYLVFTRSGKRNASGARLGLGMNTFFQVSLFCIYCSTSCAHMFLQARASSRYSPVSATILIYFGKSVVSLAMYWRSNCLDLSSLIGAAGGRFGRVPACLCTAVPAALFVMYDWLSFLSLAGIDPVTYRIVMQCRVLLAAAVWQLGFRRWCSSLQWFAMVTFVVASITKSVDTLEHDSQGSGTYRIGLLLCQVVVSAAGSVCVEVLQKELQVPTDLQNSAICIQGLLLLLPFAMRHGLVSLHDELLSSAAWERLFGDPWMVASIFCLMAHGLVMAYFLRELSVVLKEMSGTVVTVTSALVEWTALRSSSCTVVGLESVVVVVMALVVYNVDPVEARDASKSDPDPRSQWCEADRCAGPAPEAVKRCEVLPAAAAERCRY